jgi:class 3 adenylate cyclase
MADHTDDYRTPELAHVLFIDIVGYSSHPLAQQARLIEALQQAVAGSPTICEAAVDEDLLRLATGDGVALVFFRDPTAPVRCAVETARALAARPEVRVRMGINTGPVLRVADVNARENVFGGGINIAQRVMDCGDAGHILLSSTSAALAEEAGAWSLASMGECRVKHGIIVRLFNLAGEGYGNPAPPRALAKPTASEAPAGRPGVDERKVVLIYKRGAHPDEKVLRVLHESIQTAGYSVFIDRNIPIGVAWAKEIERQVTTAGAVIALISGASVVSEMLAYEVELASQAAQLQCGRPHLLPVRVDYTAELPDALAGILDPLQYFLWESEQDNDGLVEGLLAALAVDDSPAAPRGRASVATPRLGRSDGSPVALEPVGGAVPLDSALYVIRPTDEECLAALGRRDSTILIKGARQMGKTSLLARGLQHARSLGNVVAMSDFQTFNASELADLDAFFMALAENLADQLGLDVYPEDVWASGRGPNRNFERYVRREVLDRLSAPLVWGMDEVDRLFAHPYADEVFGLFRSWHNKRSLDPGGPWSRLTLLMAYATEAHLFIADLNQSPFNVGTRIALAHFAPDQVADLNERHGSPLRDGEELSRFIELLEGHPYLVRRGLHEMVSRDLSADELIGLAPRDDGPFGDHLRRYLMVIAGSDELSEAVRHVLAGRGCPDAASFYRLRSAGLVAGERHTDCRFRCGIYRDYLAGHLSG